MERCLCASVFKGKECLHFRGKKSKACSPLSEWLVLQSCFAKHIFGFPSGFLSASPLWFTSLNFFGVILLNMVGCFFLSTERTIYRLKDL